MCRRANRRPFSRCHDVGQRYFRRWDLWDKLIEPADVDELAMIGSQWLAEIRRNGWPECSVLWESIGVPAKRRTGENAAMSACKPDGRKVDLPRQKLGGEIEHLRAYATAAPAREVRGLGFLFLHRVLEVPQNRIALAFGRDRSDISRCIKAVDGDLRESIAPFTRDHRHWYQNGGGI